MRAALFCLLVLLSAPFALAGASVSHGYTKQDRELFFTPGLERDYQFSISGSEHLESFTDPGPFAAYITLEDPAQGTSNREITLHIRIPANPVEPPPGMYQVFVGAREMSSPGGMLSAKVATQTRIYINVLRDEKYAEFSINPSNVNVNETAIISVEARSLTKQDIDSVFADLSIFTSEGVLVGNTRTGSTSLKSTEIATVQGEFSTRGLTPGTYNVRGNASYDGTATSLAEVSFKIGNLNVSLVRYTREVGKDGINKIEFIVESNWNNEIKDVYGQLTMKEGNKTNQLDRTASITLDRFGQGTLKAYWDTNKLSLGNYSGTFTTFYAGESNTQPVTLAIVDMSPIVEEKKPFQISPVVLYLIIIILAITIAVISLVFGRKKREGQ